MPVKEARKQRHGMSQVTVGGKMMLGRWHCVQIFTEDEPDTEEKGRGLGKRFAKINWLRAGILSADKVLTVSPNYAAEIAANPQMGVELDDVLRWVALLDKVCQRCISFLSGNQTGLPQCGATPCKSLQLLEESKLVRKSYESGVLKCACMG